MVLRVFFISTTGRRDIRKRQIHVFAVLSSWQFDFESIDVAAPENEKERDFVIESGKKTDDGKIMLPQIFKEEECCGDYVDFLQAIEHEKLKLFLKQMTQEEFDAMEQTKEEPAEGEKAEGDEEELGEKAEGEGEEGEETEKNEDGEETETKGEGEEDEDAEKKDDEGVEEDAEKAEDEEAKVEDEEETKEEAEEEEETPKGKCLLLLDRGQ